MSALPDSEELYEHAACGLIAFRLDGTILHANQTLLNWLGISHEDITSKKITDLLYKGGKLYYNLFVQPILQLHARVDEINFEMQTPTASFHVLFSAVTYELKNGEGSVVNGTIFKIADRKKYEAELIKEKEQVKHENQAKAEALTTIAFNQAHLIRAPLANIIGLIDLLETNQQFDGNTRQLLGLLSESAYKLDTVVRDIVDLSDQSA
jgi:sigma-B regulation protein RsbU (phosphoserine phosphatase)